ncbi:hypothetical protein AVEN_171287-1, partial [Araneus ventricosus]
VCNVLCRVCGAKEQQVHMFPRNFNRNLATRTLRASTDGPDEIYYHDNVYRMDICKFLHACSSPHHREDVWPPMYDLESNRSTCSRDLQPKPGH